MAGKDDRLKAIVRKYQRDMAKLGVGVSMKAGDGAYHVVVRAPGCTGEADCPGDVHSPDCPCDRRA